MYMYNCTLPLIWRNRQAAGPIWYNHVHSNSTNIKLYMNINHKLNLKKSRLLHIQQKFYTDCFAFQMVLLYTMQNTVHILYFNSCYIRLYKVKSNFCRKTINYLRLNIRKSAYDIETNVEQMNQ